MSGQEHYPVVHQLWHVLYVNNSWSVWLFEIDYAEIQLTMLAGYQTDHKLGAWWEAYSERQSRKAFLKSKKITSTMI